MEKNQKIGDGMRWLYDDDESYEKAVRKMRIEAAREERKKQLAKKTRVVKLKRAKTKMLRKVRSSGYLRTTWRNTSKKAMLVSGVGLAMVVVVPAVMLHKNSNKVTTVQGASDQNKAPEFDVVTPKRDQTGISAKMAYDEQRKVASYSDKVGLDPIVVSQQPLPDKFKVDPAGELEKFAKQINANDKIEVGETVAYSGVSAKGPQTVVLIKNGVLLFLTSQKKLQSKAWFDYISNLQ